MGLLLREVGMGSLLHLCTPSTLLDPTYRTNSLRHLTHRRVLIVLVPFHRI